MLTRSVLRWKPSTPRTAPDRMSQVQRLTLVFAWLGAIGLVVQSVTAGPLGPAAAVLAVVVMGSWVRGGNDRWWVAVVEGVCAAVACLALPDPQRTLGFVFGTTVRRTLVHSGERLPVKAVGVVLGYLIGTGIVLSSRLWGGTAAFDIGAISAALLPLVGLVIGSMALHAMVHSGRLARTAALRAEDERRAAAAVLEASPIGLLLLDHTGTPQLYNRRALPLLRDGTVTTLPGLSRDHRGGEGYEIPIIRDDGTTGHLELRSITVERSEGPDYLLLTATEREAPDSGDAPAAGGPIVPPMRSPLDTPVRRTRPLGTQRSGAAAELLTALADGQFVVHYQPIVELGTGEVTGTEALVRWQRPGYGLVSPGEFVETAEKTGVIVPLGHHVLTTACEQAARWHAEGRSWGVTVNVSTKQLWDPGFTAAVSDLVSRVGLPPAALTLEVTESAWADENALDTLTDLRGLGVRVALDDFGTGFSSLGYLLRHPFDVIKVDRSFTAELRHNARAAGVVRCVLGLADTLGARTVAEGVEHREQADWLRLAGCTHAQGYLYGRPQPADALTEGPSDQAC
ncbi:MULTISPECIES: EAL domain-containing protein [unclassified Saccharothrix]|uniref:EAL domain-containing protein n=1 Tax=unclassified Saccharothrix TaxID=2593673 RepID=UPI00307E7D2F